MVPYIIVDVFPNGNYTVAGKCGKVRTSKMYVGQVKKYFDKEVVECTMPSELPEAPKDVHQPHLSQ